LDFEEVAAVIGIDGVGLDADACDEVGRFRREDEGAEAAGAVLGVGEVEVAVGGDVTLGGDGAFGRHQAFAAPSRASASLRATDCDTRLAARSSESKVPASVHQPSR